MQQQNVIERHGEPNQYDHAPYGTICKVKNSSLDQQQYALYKQTSQEEENPRWVLLDVYV